MNITDSLRFLRVLCGLAALAPAALLAQTPTETANALLFAPGLTGTQSSVKWTNLSSANTTLAPTSGTGTITVNSPGFKATAGFYSFSNTYGTTVTSQPVAFDINTVVFQFVGMLVVGEGYDLSVADHLAFSAPTLTYNLAGGGSGVVAADFSGSLDGPIAGTGGGFEGDYYNFSWQWNLSSVTGVIESVSVTSPLHVHQSVIGAQLTVGDTFSGSVVPEPSAYAAVFGVLALAGACVRRGRRGQTL